jgi:hypothetical protein
MQRGKKELGTESISTESKAECAVDEDHGSDLPSVIYHTQPLTGRNIDLGNVLESSEEHTHSHHCQQLKFGAN